LHVVYTVQRTLPAPLTGSENYIYDLGRLISESDRVTILATRGNGDRPPNPDNVGSGEVLTFPERDLRSLGLALRYLMIKDPTGLLRYGVAYPANGLLHSWSYGYWSPKMYEWLRAAHPDVLHCQALPLATTWVGWKASRATKCPFVITPSLHLEDPNFGLPYIGRIVRDADAVIAQTETEKRYIVRLGVPPERTWVIPPGVNPDSSRRGSGSRFRGASKIAPDDFVVLIPRKLKEKGTFHTLAALQELGKEGRHPVGVVLGTSPWPIQRSLQSWVAKLSAVGTRVVDAGFLSEQAFRDCVAACDVLVEPSMVDSFGMVYQDAWMAGKPVIAADCGAIPDVVRDHEDGILVPYGSSESIAEAIRYLMDNRGTAQRLGERGRTETLERYDNRQLAGRVRKVYDAAIAHREASR